MHPILSRAKELLVDVPRHGKLAYCRCATIGFRRPKAMRWRAVLIVNPIDLPAWVPLMVRWTCWRSGFLR
jgi:hypothetical protein